MSERRTRSFRGISVRLAANYLENLGGERAGDEGEVTRVDGDGWTATLSEEKVNITTSLQLNEVTVVFEGDSDVLDPLVEAFAQKAMRAGG